MINILFELLLYIIPFLRFENRKLDFFWEGGGGEGLILVKGFFGSRF